MPYSPDVMATLDPYSDVRPAILELLKEFAIGGMPWPLKDGRKPYIFYTSNQAANRGKFLEWTGRTQEGLEADWAAAERREKETGKKQGYVSCCEAFMGKLVQKLIAMGWCPILPFQTFGLFQLRPAWHWLDEYKPQAGDFFQTGRRVARGPVPMSAGHVGVIYRIVSEDNWVTIESGLGGHNTKFDAVGRVEGAKPLGVQGCVNVDEYFFGLAKPSANQQLQAATGKPIQAPTGKSWQATAGR